MCTRIELKEVPLNSLIISGIECMAKECPVLVTEDFVYKVLSDSKLRDKYSKFSFNDLIKVGHASVCLLCAHLFVNSTYKGYSG